MCVQYHDVMKKVSLFIFLLIGNYRGVLAGFHSPQGKCLLLLQRTSAVPYSPHHSVNSLLHPSQHLGSTCITGADVDAAFAEAIISNKSPLPPPDGKFTPENVGVVGTTLLETTRVLAERFSLTPHEIHELQNVPMAGTAVGRVCPAYAAPQVCHPTRYRRHDGLCNNLRFPTWGATRATFTRFLPPVFADGLAAPRVSVGHPHTTLPTPRRVSAHIHRDDGYHDHAISLLFLAWAQFMDHDFTLTATPLDPHTRNEPENSCCHQSHFNRHPECLEINIPREDRFFSLFGQDCIDFFRGLPGLRQDCRLGYRAPFNILTSVIDVNTVYGGSHKDAHKLRKFKGGLMKMNNVFKSLGLKELLPAKRTFVDEGCTRSAPNLYCFEAGEIRVNEQLILTTIHTLWFREHNRVCRELKEMNPHWGDETLYQESRRIIIAQVQHITFNEFLPLLLGKQVMQRYGLLLQKEGYWDGYDPTVDPSMAAAFITSAFRFGHSLLPSAVERWSPSGTFMGSVRLSRLIRQPFDLYRAGVLDEYYMGLITQPVQAMDDAITQEITNHLFEEPEEHFGMDLVSLNLQRGREFGVPGYTAFRDFCGLHKVNSFYDLSQLMTNVTAHRYGEVYSHVDDIDLFSGGVSERPLEGSLLGPTFSCLVAKQISRVRHGDRFWYELPGQPSSFTPAQLQALRQTQLSRVLCQNTDRVPVVQVYPMILADPEINPRVACGSGQIPRLDLTPWKELPYK